MAKDTPAKAKGGVKKARRTKDPNAPKRPKSAYFFYMDDVRAQVKKDNPELSVSELGKKMGEMWNKIKDTTDPRIEGYRKQAAKDKERYEREIKAYRAQKH